MQKMDGCKWDYIHICYIREAVRLLAMGNSSDIFVKAPILREQQRDVMTAATGGGKLSNPASVCCIVQACALLRRMTWSHGLPFPPDIMSDELDLIPTTCPTSSRSSTPARGVSHSGELPRRRDLFYLISFNRSDTFSFYINLSVCIFSAGEDAAAAGGIRDSSLTSHPQILTLEINLLPRFLCCVCFCFEERDTQDVQIKEVWPRTHYNGAVHLLKSRFLSNAHLL